MVLVSVLTPSVPERADMLNECIESVLVQKCAFEHLIHVDREYAGCSVTVNLLADKARGRWLFLLADDDLLLPGCLKAHLAAADGADIVYSPPVVEGEPEPPFHGDPPGIPSTALISANLWRHLGGYDPARTSCEDFDFFERALLAGAVFRRIPEQTWTYRFHGGNKSRAPR